jgi:hypothetical protein
MNVALEVTQDREATDVSGPVPHSAFRIPYSALPYLRLVRFPAVFSAFGDPLAGALIARDTIPPRRAARAVSAAAAVYLAGMALNDLADREEDARERPERPIPSGAVSAGQAAALGGALLLTGALAARGAGARRTGVMLPALVIAYNFALKHSPLLGPAAMGGCRALSLLVGAEAVGGERGVGKATGAAALLGTYVAGITVLARGETGGATAERTTRLGAGLAASALLGTIARGGARSLPLGLAAAGLAGPAVRRAVRDPRPSRVGPAVGALIRAIPALDGSLAATRSPWRAAAFALPLLALARWGRTLIPIT